MKIICDKIICGFCRGTGDAEIKYYMQRYKTECPYCKGSGEIRRDENFNEKDWDIAAFPAEKGLRSEK